MREIESREKERGQKKEVREIRLRNTEDARESERINERPHKGILCKKES